MSDPNVSSAPPVGNIVPIPFHGDTLFAFECGDGVYLAIPPICHRLGLDVKSQRRRIEDDPVLSKGGARMTLPSAGGMQETLCLKVQMVALWLAGINISRVKESAREMVAAYQQECADVLFEHFFVRRQDGSRDRMAIEAHSLKLVREARRDHGKRFAAKLWFELGLPGDRAASETLRQPDLPLVFDATPAAEATEVN